MSEHKRLEVQHGGVLVPMMTLRDWFAGQALAGAMAAFFAEDSSWDDYDDMAESIHGVVDAMMRARARDRSGT